MDILLPNFERFLKKETVTIIKDRNVKFDDIIFLMAADFK